jgi:hypothetical protein
MEYVGAKAWQRRKTPNQGAQHFLPSNIGNNHTAGGPFSEIFRYETHRNRKQTLERNNQNE